MAHDIEIPGEEDQVLEEQMAEDQPQDADEMKKAVPAWIISIVVHLVVMGLLSLIVYAAKEEIEDVPIKTTSLPVPPKVEEPKVERDIKPTEMPLDVELEVEKPSPISNLDVPVENFSREEETDSEVPKGREEAKADSEMGGEGAFMAIGAGGGGSGMFGSRSGGGKKRALGKFGGNKGSESAVDAALRWFKKHQSPNGMWDVDGYPANCQENPKCEPGTANTNEAGDIAGSAYAILCFLGAGYDHRMPSKYKSTVKKGLDWLVSMQKADGAFGTQNYEQGIATMALAEAYAMSNDPGLKAPSQNGIDLLLKRQTPDKAGGYGLAWDYTAPNTARMDSSVSGWCVMALKSGAAGGLNVGNGMEGAKRWFELAWKAKNPNFKATDPYTDESDFPYTYNSDANTADGPGRAAIGALCAVFLGHKADDPMLNSLANYVIKFNLPVAYPPPSTTYYLYYSTLAIFQVGGEHWNKWNKTVRDLLVGAQRKGDGCFDGSWDPQGAWGALDFPGGRIINTAYCCLSLEVYYRYIPVALKR